MGAGYVNTPPAPWQAMTERRERDRQDAPVREPASARSFPGPRDVIASGLRAKAGERPSKQTGRAINPPCQAGRQVAVVGRDGRGTAGPRAPRAGPAR